MRNTSETPPSIGTSTHTVPSNARAATAGDVGSAPVIGWYPVARASPTSAPWGTTKATPSGTAAHGGSTTLPSIAVTVGGTRVKIAAVQPATVIARVFMPSETRRPPLWFLRFGVGCQNLAANRSAGPAVIAGTKPAAWGSSWVA
jgi:hypothetical protein